MRHDLRHVIEWAAGLPVSRAHQMVAVAIAAYGPTSAYRLARLLRASMRPILHALRRLEATGAVERRGQLWAATSVMGDTNSVTGDTILVSPATPILSTQILCAGPPLMVPPYNPLPLSPPHPTTILDTNRNSENNLSLVGLNVSAELKLSGTRDNFSRTEVHANSDCDPTPTMPRTPTSDQVATSESPITATGHTPPPQRQKSPRTRKRTPTRPAVAGGPQTLPITESGAPSACHENLPAVSPEIHHPVAQPQGAPGSETWEAYASAYEQRYGSRPPRNARTNSMCLQLVRRVGAEDAPKLAAWYVARAGGIHMRARHPLSLLLRDCEVLLVEMRDWRPAFAREWEQQRREIVEGIEWAIEHGLIFAPQPKTGGHNGNGRHAS